MARMFSTPITIQMGGDEGHSPSANNVDVQTQFAILKPYCRETFCRLKASLSIVKSAIEM